MLVYSVLRISDFSESQVELLRGALSVHFGKDINKQRKESVIGKALLVYMLECHYGITDFSIHCTESGKPYIIGNPIYFNISHSDDYVLCVCGSDEVGCDIENIRTYNEKVAGRFFSEAEYKRLSESENPDVDFTRMWTLKESVLKHSGEGLSGGLGLWDFSEHFTCSAFQMKGLRFSCRENGNLIISICSTDNDSVELKTDINKILGYERGNL